MSKGARLRSPGRKIRRALRRTPPAYFDLVQWLLDRGYANTRRKAKDLILAGKVKADSHVIGRGKGVDFNRDTGKFEEVDVVMQHVPVALKGRVVVETAS